jgi:hypothetical protein
MIHFGRCGSTVIANLLNQHPEIKWHGEIYSEFLKKQIPEVKMTSDPNKILDLRMGLYPSKYFGFELKAFDAADLGPKVLNQDFENYYHLLSEKGFRKFVILERKNFLKQIVSIQIGLKTKVMHKSSGESADLFKVFIDPGNVTIGFEHYDLLSAFQLYENSYSRIYSTIDKENLLRLVYEDDVLPGPKLAYEKICEFISLEPEAVDVNLSRTNPYRLNELIINYQEIQKLLQGTKYECFLVDES